MLVMLASKHSPLNFLPKTPNYQDSRSLTNTDTTWYQRRCSVGPQTLLEPLVFHCDVLRRLRYTEESQWVFVLVFSLIPEIRSVVTTGLQVLLSLNVTQCKYKVQLLTSS